jgi:hypothetical protein
MNAMGFLAVSAALCLGVSAAHADVVTEWNLKTAQFTLDARIPPPDANQVVATTSMSVSDALTAISGKFPPLLVKLSPSPGASVDATVAAASHGVLLQMLPGQQAALAKIPDNASQQSGIARPDDQQSSCERWLLPAFTTASITGIQPRLAPRWASRSVSLPPPSTFRPDIEVEGEINRSS